MTDGYPPGESHSFHQIIKGENARRFTVTPGRKKLPGPLLIDILLGSLVSPSKETEF